MPILFKRPFFGWSFFLFSFVFALVPRAQADTGDESCRAATVEALAGRVVIASGGNDTTAAEGAELGINDQLKSGADSWADLRLCDGTGLRVGENSDFTLLEASRQSGFWNWAFDLARGTLRAVVQGEGNGDSVKFRVRTPTAALGVRGTEFLVEVEQGAGEPATRLHTLEGEVLLGSHQDWESFRSLKGKKLLERFEPVRREQMSTIRRGERRAHRAVPFRMRELRQLRRTMFQRPFQRVDRAEAQNRKRGILEGRKRHTEGPRRQAVESFRRRFRGRPERNRNREE